MKEKVAKIKKLSKDLSQLEAMKGKDISNFRHWARLEKNIALE